MIVLCMHLWIGPAIQWDVYFHACLASSYCVVSYCVFIIYINTGYFNLELPVRSSDLCVIHISDCHIQREVKSKFGRLCLVRANMSPRHVITCVLLLIKVDGAHTRDIGLCSILDYSLNVNWYILKCILIMIPHLSSSFYPQPTSLPSAGTHVYNLKFAESICILRFYCPPVGYKCLIRVTKENSLDKRETRQPYFGNVVLPSAQYFLQLL